MDAKADIREFLTTRRAKVTPEQAGLPAYGGARRRVAGLRREEVALLAGISVEYYTRLERGTAAGVSEDVLDGIARALQLDEAERGHLLDLVRTAGASRPPRRRPAAERVRPSVQRVLDSLSAPAFVRNGRLDILATNRWAMPCYSELYVDPVRPANYARFMFLSPRATSSSPTGTGSPTTPWPSCVPRPAATPTTAGCRISSASCRPAATTSASAGPPTT